ncbi:TadE family protein [Butyrivibrio sp. VCB2006]|uniref:TadE family protein n=1 Tax=Butyrivibrio sp. VCB2006 TaxID=1280679 RepID=UPI00042860B5|nr:TadE family protein [Butyrivibrio sp. VCB2006]
MRKLPGYMTVEASFIVPMIICVFVLIIYFSNYVYARCILAQDSYILAFRASMDKEANPATVVDSKKNAVAGKKYYGNRSPTFDCSTSGKEIEVTGGTETKHSAMGRFFLKPKGSWKLKSRQYAKKRDYSGHIRTVKRIRDIGTKE